MTWVKLDDGFYDHPKVEGLSLEAVGLWTLCASYCGKHLSDGFVGSTRVRKLGGTDAAVAELIESGLWDEVPGGIQFHDWAEYQFTRSQVESKRESDRERKRKQRRNDDGTYAESQAESAKSHSVTPDGLPTGSREESHRPVPSRPVPSQERAVRRSPERPLPADWNPNGAHLDYARSKNLDIAMEAERFKAHAQANDRRLRDWNAGFRMWLTKAKPSPAQEHSVWTM